MLPSFGVSLWVEAARLDEVARVRLKACDTPWRKIEAARAILLY